MRQIKPLFSGYHMADREHVCESSLGLLFCLFHSSCENHLGA